MTASDGAVLAFDLGGTRVKSGIVHGDAISDLSVDEAGADPMAVVLDRAQHLLGAQPCAAVGLCVPGLVDDGVLVSLPGKHAGLEGTDLRRTLSGALGLPAYVANDAIAYAVGEATAGAALGHHRAAVITIGTGVGVGVVEDGRPLGGGPLGGGLMSGMIPIAAGSEFADTNGQHGTIEALCAAARLLSGEAATRHETVPELLASARTGEPTAVAAVDRWRADFSRAVTAIAHAHAPSVVVVGGGPLSDDDLVLDGVERAVNDRLFGAYRVMVRRARLGDAAALHGIAHLARQLAA